MELTVITEASQAAALNFGDQYVLEVPGFDGPEHDVEEFAEAYLKLRDEVAVVLGNQTGNNGNNGNGNVKVDIADTVVAITSPVETQVDLAGDVRDGTINLEAGKTKTRKLTDEGHGYITVDGVIHERP